MTSFADLQQRALAIRDQYEQLEHAKYGRRWSREELTLGFVGDVGDLAKLAIAAENMRDIDDAKAKFEHELADCLWSILVMAKEYDVDLEAGFTRTMDGLESKIATKLNEAK